MNFIHLHTHSHYSLLDGLAKIDDLINQAKANNMSALALTDHGVMYGTIEFYEKCQKAGIKPIIGVEMYLAPNGRQNKTAKVDDVRYHLVLLAKNNIGYQNLIKLTSIAHLEGFYYRPRIDWEILTKYKEGLIALSACLQGEIPVAILSGDQQRTEQTVKRYHDLFGPGNFYLELQSHPSIPEQAQVNRELAALSKKFNIPLIATNDIHYLKKDDDEAHDVLVCLQTKHKKEDEDRMCMLGEDFSFKSTEQMQREFLDFSEAIANAEIIVNDCSVEIELGKIKLPYFEVPDNKDANQYLRELAYRGLKKRYNVVVDQDLRIEGDLPVTVLERLEYELEVIRKTGFASYFLIVQDFVNWAKNQGIVVGPGRGSAPGSLVSYLTNITNVDPIKYDLIFERFLNPDRVSMPDIDLDFADTRRDEVIDYVSQKYGYDHVAQIITFGTMAARVAVRDVGRVLGFAYNYCDRVAKLIPMFADLDEALALEPELKELYNNDPDAKRLIDTAKKLEGVARHSSTHACGVLITPEPLTNYVPLQYASSGDKTIVSQYSLHPIEDLGLLKMDFLGLKNLTILEQTIEIIRKIHGLEIDLDTLPLEDLKTFQLLQAAHTTGVFQLESEGMKRYLKQLGPNQLEDIIAMVSLYRPGPMEFIPDFIVGKSGKKKVKYLHPKLEPILTSTYGVAIYQEQILRIARDLAGFSLSEADVLRKAVGKKIASLLKQQKDKFINGCVKNGIGKRTAEQIFDFIEPFARYGFNRAHAACYAMIAYQTAYFKANYPVEFMASLLTSDQGDMDRVAIEVEECENMGIIVLPPDINESYMTFTVVRESLGTDQPRIRFGLLAIKNLGEGVSRAIIHERKANGPYQSLEDFLSRVKSKDLNKKSIESLAKSGALDNLAERNAVIYNIDKILNFIKEINQQALSAQASLFSQSTAGPLLALKLDPAPAATRRECLTWEKEFLGLYISGHPYKEFERDLREITSRCNELVGLASAGEIGVRVGGVITDLKKVYTRSGEPMLFAKIEDTTGSTELIIFPKILKALSQFWQEDKIVVAEGKLSDKDGEIKVIVNRAAEVTGQGISKLVGEYKGPVVVRNGYGNTRDGANTYPPNYYSTPTPKPNNPSGRVVIKFSRPPDPATAERLKSLFSQFPGQQQVYLLIINQGKKQIIQTPFKVNSSPDIKVKIEEFTGIGTCLLDK